MIFSLFVSVINVFLYIAIIWMGLKMWRFVQNKYDGTEKQDQRLKKLNRQLTVNLLLQVRFFYRN